MPNSWMYDQIAEIERTGTTDSVDIMGMPVVMLTMTGAKSGEERKVPLMRVEHDGVYIAVGSKGGAPENPQWVHNLRAQPDILLQDGTETNAVRARELDGAERAEWWPRCVEAFPSYADYQSKTDRLIPLFALEAPPNAEPA